VAGRDGGWQVKNWLAEVVADKGTFIFWRPLTSPPPPPSLSPSIHLSLVALRRYVGNRVGRRVGFANKTQKKETKRKNSKERKRKRSLILSFQIFINDY
jgi:hypothetical protein